MRKIVYRIIVLGVMLTLSLGPAYAAKQKVLYVNSYHSYGWTDGIREGILNTLNITMDAQGQLDNSASRVELKIVQMDTKRNPSEEFKKDAALKVKAVIESWEPDVVIASDDNASKYLIVPYFNNTDLPFVFCGVNWDASAYGFPSANVTGMLEVILIPQIIETLSAYAQGARVGYIKGDDLSARKDAEHFHANFNIELIEKYVTNFEEWKTAYLALQDEADMILVGNFASVADLDTDEARQFIEEFTTVPTGNWDEWMSEFTLVTYANRAAEQGEWAANAALEILAGKSPEEIPIVSNKKARISLHMRLAKKLGIKFPLKLIKRSTLIQ